MDNRPKSDPRTSSPASPVLLKPEVTHRVTLLAELQAALTAHGVQSVLARNRRLVLSSSGRGPNQSGPTDPQLHIFRDDDQTDLATTDGTSYRFADGRTHPADDAHGAAMTVITVVSTAGQDSSRASAAR